MNIVGRQEEIEILKSILDSPRSEFLAIYGRRRVGKTYLIREFFKKNILFECAGLVDEEKEDQLENFQLTINEYFKNSNPKPKSWQRAFKQLGENINTVKHKNKKVIFLDEIPWFDTHKSRFLAALDKFWNQFCTKRNDIILVICGSSASWIIDKVVNDKGGLHNRVTHTIKLPPFTLGETKLYLTKNKIKLSQADIAKLYMCIGGIPFYLNHIQTGKSFPQILDNLFFKNNAALKEEFDKLYKALFKKHEIHIEIIKTLSKKQAGMTRMEIINNSSLSSGGGLTDALTELEQCSFISSTQSMYKIKMDKVYRLTDEFSLFYLDFIYRKTTKMNGNTLTSSQKFKIWTGYAFENLCLKHVAQIAQSLGINGILYDVNSWMVKGNGTNAGAQIDLVIERSDNCINLIEMKFYEREYTMTKAYASQLKSRELTFIESVKTKKNVFTTLITSNGCIKNEHYFSAINNEVKMDDLFNNL